MKDIAVIINNHNYNLNPIETTDVINKIGFKNVFTQWYNKDWEYSQEEQLEYARKLGLNVIFVHLGYKDINYIWEDGDKGDLIVEGFLKDLKVCKENNINLVVMHLTSKTNAKKYNEIGLNRIKKIVKCAKELDIKIAFENTKMKGYLEYILTNIKDDNVGICYDTGHCHAYFDDKFDFDLCKNRIFAVHIHDNDSSDDQHLIPFDGTINWDKVIKDLKYANYKGPVTLEVVYSKDYINMTPTEFYTKVYKIGEKLVDMFE